MTAVQAPADSYDTLADQYDDLFSTPEARQQDLATMAMIGYTGGSVLDIGCGTGLFLDCHPQCTEYLGIDPSEGMLRRLREKHPAARTQQARFEDYLAAAGNERFDWIISLYGSPSYVDGHFLRQADTLLASGGAMLMMFYQEGYTPQTHRYLDCPPPIIRHRFADYGSCSLYGNYVVVTR